jgi:hypothetical protein
LSGATCPRKAAEGIWSADEGEMSADGKADGARIFMVRAECRRIIAMILIDMRVTR